MNIEVIKRESINAITDFNNLENVDLMQEFNTSVIKLQCYNLGDSNLFPNDYGIVLYSRKTNATNYAYFNDLTDMFLYYDALRNNYKEI